MMVFTELAEMDCGIFHLFKFDWQERSEEYNHVQEELPHLPDQVDLI